MLSTRNKDKAEKLFRKWYGTAAEHTDPLPVSGSSRQYVRCRSGNTTAIAALNDDVEENEAFLYLSGFFLKEGLRVPRIYTTDTDRKTYLLEDLGDTTLYELLKDRGSDDPQVKKYYHQVLQDLIAFQFSALDGLDFDHCYPVREFDRQAIGWDLNYFKYYFLKLSGIPFNEARLQKSFDKFTALLLEQERKYFMYRDFQARNIMVRDEQLYYIDYQGGRQGPLSYDLASLLFNTRANLSAETREEYLEKYIEFLAARKPVNKKEFRREFYTMALARVLQAMGAYGYRGYFERKKLFLAGIPFGLRNLRWLLQYGDIPLDDYFRNLLTGLEGSGKLAEIAESPLQLSVQSFSYKNGLPADQSGHGGGFIFDCRALPNPGREEKYRELSGKDEEVIAYLEESEDVDHFVEQCINMVRGSVQKYIDRGFDHLSVSFGCTGGQHRSVYCAERLAEVFRKEKGVEVRLRHLQLQGPH